MKWIAISWAGTSASGKTDIYTVRGNDEYVLLGRVKWHGPWRKYAFYPETRTLFEQDCLRDIAQFCEDTTRAHRQRRTAGV